MPLALLAISYNKKKTKNRMSIKGITSADDYVYSLSDDLKKVAANDLRETEATIQHALKAMREWVEQNERITNLRLDSSFFLRFLRSKKFSIPMTQECIERYLLLREYYDGLLFKNMNYTDPALMELVNLGYIFALPKRDKLGRRIIFTRPGMFHPTKFPNYEMLRIHGITYETLMEDEENQIRGFVHIIDAAGVGFPHMTLFTPKEAYRIVKNAEKTLPMRHKSFDVINVNPSLKYAVDFCLTIVSEKMRNRIHFHSSLKNANIDLSLLPKEYGGDVPMADMIESWKKELEAAKSTLMRNDGMTLKLELYSEKARAGAVSALKQNFCYAGSNTQDGIYGIQGSFRKLEVD